MREIKFRAWVKEEYKFSNSEAGMYTGFSFKDIYSGHDEANTYCEDEKILQEPKWNNLILMQYTGLKDKNDKDIYEGDIYRHNSEYGYHARDKKLYVVESLSDFFQEKGLDEGEYNGDWSVIEVIGNIYENPELLEANRA